MNVSALDLNTAFHDSFLEEHPEIAEKYEQAYNDFIAKVYSGEIVIDEFLAAWKNNCRKKFYLS